MKCNLLGRAAVSCEPHFTGCEDQLLLPPLYHKLQQPQQFLWEPLSNMSCCPCKGWRKITWTTLVVDFMLQCLSFLYLFSLPVGITLPAVPAVPRSLVAIIVAIIMFQQFCQLSALWKSVSGWDISRNTNKYTETS